MVVTVQFPKVVRTADLHVTSGTCLFDEALKARVGRQPPCCVVLIGGNPPFLCLILERARPRLFDEVRPFSQACDANKLGRKSSLSLCRAYAQCPAVVRASSWCCRTNVVALSRRLLAQSCLPSSRFSSTIVKTLHHCFLFLPSRMVAKQ